MEAANDSGPALDHVQIAAPPGCEPQARWFFGDLLGLPEVEKPEALRGRGGAWFALGDQQLHIGVADPFMPARKAHPAIRVAADDLDALAQRIAGHGLAVTWDDGLAGSRRFYCDDPWGNRIEILARV